MKTIDRRHVAADLRQAVRVAASYALDEGRGPAYALGWLETAVKTAIVELEAGQDNAQERRQRLREEIDVDLSRIRGARQ